MRVARSIAITLIGCTAVACGEPSGPHLDPLVELPRTLSVAESQLIQSDNAFAFTLFREVNRQDETGGNVFVSPLSVAMALAMAYNGAAGTTRDAMRQTLLLENLSIDDVNASYRSLIDLLRGLDERVEFTIANSIWHDQAFTPVPAFVDATSTYFDAVVRGLDFRSASAAPTINQWVSDSTRGKIQEIVADPIPWDVIAYLINAIYFKADWTHQFDPDLTAREPFERPDGSTVTVDMMSYAGKAPLDVAAVNGYLVVDLPYSREAYSMTIVVPATAASIEELAASVTAEQWAGWIAALGESEGVVSMPKYTLEWEADLKDVLSTLGMAETFCPNPADLTDMFQDVGPGDLCFSEVKHKTFVDVNEEGTEAAAVTSIGIALTSAPAVTLIDRPFLFAIRERLSGTIIFMGKIVDPS